MPSLKMIVPPFLQSGDTIGVLSTARKIEAGKISPAIGLFHSWGYKVLTGKTIGASCHQFAGDDAFRASNLQTMLDDPEIKAIICARGGYGTSRIIDSIDFSRFRKNPKWICGYSDVSVLHNHLQQQHKILSLHSTMPIHLDDSSQDEQSFTTLRDCLQGNWPAYGIPPRELNVHGSAKGQLTGGNLSILYHLMGSPSEVDFEGKILFLEDVDEYLYHVDRMMLTLKRAGKLEKLKGVIVGSFTKMRDNEIPFGKEAEEILAGYFNPLGIPVCYGFPAGHAEKNLALVMGAEVEMTVDREGVKLGFEG